MVTSRDPKEVIKLYKTFLTIAKGILAGLLLGLVVGIWSGIIDSGLKIDFNAAEGSGHNKLLGGSAVGVVYVILGGLFGGGIYNLRNSWAT